MTETSGENPNNTDLGALLASVPPGVINILGEEQVIAIEHPKSQAEKLLAISRLPNPFDKYPGLTESVITPEVEHALAEIERVDDRTDRLSPEISEVARQYAPVLKQSSKEHRYFIATKYNTAIDWLKEMRERLSELDTEDAERATHELCVHYELLEQIAQNLPAAIIAEDFIKVIKAENDAFSLDAMSVGMRKNPQLHDKYLETWEESLKLRFRNQKAKASELLKKHTSIGIAS